MSEVRTLPVLPLRDIVVFPHMVVPLFVGREKVCPRPGGGDGAATSRSFWPPRRIPPTTSRSPAPSTTWAWSPPSCSS